MSNASQIKATGTFSTHLLLHHHRLDTPNSKRNYVQHHKQQCYFQLVQKTLLRVGGAIMKLYNWSAKFHLKNVGVFRCLVKTERREGRGTETERKTESSRKDKGVKVRTVTSIFCNPSA